jgi:hypothetical protein
VTFGFKISLDLHFVLHLDSCLLGVVANDIFRDVVGHSILHACFYLSCILYFFWESIVVVVPLMTSTLLGSWGAS